MSMEQVPLLILEVCSLHPQLIYIALDEEDWVKSGGGGGVGGWWRGHNCSELLRNRQLNLKIH